MRPALCLLLLCGCGSSSQPANDAQLTIVEEDAGEPEPEADDTPPELMEPSPDPTITCLRVADRLDRCNAERASAVLEDLEPEERAQAESALKDAAAAIETMRAQCRGELVEEEASFVQELGKCLSLGCAALRECVSRPPR